MILPVSAVITSELILPFYDLAGRVVGQNSAILPGIFSCETKLKTPVH